DHQNDWSLVDAKVPGRHPTAIAALGVRKSWIESGLQSVGMIDAHFDLIKVFECRQNDLWGKRQRCHHPPRRQRSIIRAVGDAPRNIVEEDALHSIDRQLFRSWAFTRSQSPAYFAVTLEAIWISLRVLSLRV